MPTLTGWELCTWRAGKAYPGDTVLVYSPMEPQSLLGAFLPVPDGWAVDCPLRHNDNFFNFLYAQNVTIPVNCVPGTYTIGWTDLWGRGDWSVAVNVVAPPARTPVARMPLGATAADINHSINTRGSRVIKFDPGTYYLEAPIVNNDTANPVWLDGEGRVRLVRLPDASPGNRVFNMDATAGDINAKGITFVGNGYGTTFGWHVNDAGAARRLDIVECEFEEMRAMVTPAADDPTTSVSVYRCKFGRGSGTGYLGARTWVNWCEFTGGNRTFEYPYLLTGVDRVVSTNNDFRGTNRGMVQNGTFHGCLGIDNRFFDIFGTEFAGGENVMLYTEPATVDSDASYNLYMNVFSGASCMGPTISMFGNGLHHNVFREVHSLAHGSGLLVAQLAATQDLTGHPANHDNVFTNFDVQGAVQVSGDCRNNVFDNFFARDIPPSCGNGIAFHTDYQPGLPIKELSTHKGDPDLGNLWSAQVFIMHPRALRRNRPDQPLAQQVDPADPISEP